MQKLQQAESLLTAQSDLIDGTWLNAGCSDANKEGSQSLLWFTALSCVCLTHIVCQNGCAQEQACTDAQHTMLAIGLRIKLGSTQQQELSPQDMQHQHFQVVQDGSLAEVQESKTAHLLAAVADYVQQTTVAPGSLRYTSEHSLAAVQQHHMVGMIKEVTQYLQKDLMCMQQTCRKLAARQG